MKVLQVLPTLSAGGAEAFVANLCISMAQAGVVTQLHVLTCVRDTRGRLLREKLQDSGVQVTGNRFASIKSWRVPINFLHAANKFRPNYIQANLHSSEVIVAAARPFLKSNPKLVRRLANSRSLGLSNSLALRWLDHRFDLTIACSNVVREFYETELSFSRNRFVETILNGSVLKPEPPSDAEKTRARAELGIRAEARVFVHIGRMSPVSRKDDSLEASQKAHDVLIKAFAQAFAGDVSKVLLLVGDGSLRKRLEKLADSLGIAEQTRFLGMLPEPWPALESADIFVFPSRFEGHPNVIPEAISCGLPLVVSDIPENRDMLFNAPHRLVRVDDVDKFSNAMEDFDLNFSLLKAKARAAAPEIFAAKSMDNCAFEYISAFNKIGN